MAVQAEVQRQLRRQPHTRQPAMTAAGGSCLSACPVTQRQDAGDVQCSVRQRRVADLPDATVCSVPYSSNVKSMLQPRCKQTRSSSRRHSACVTAGRQRFGLASRLNDPPRHAEIV